MTTDTSPLKICFATSECVPFVKTGGLADVSGALPKALAPLGCDMRVFLPLYRSIHTVDHGIRRIDDLRDIPVQIGRTKALFSVWAGTLPDSDVPVYLIDCPQYFHRDQLYTGDLDEDERFILFQHAVVLTLQRLKWAPDIVHCNDWQTSLLPVLLKISYAWDRLFIDTKFLLTIHNIAYQGLFSRDAVYKAGLSYDNFHHGGPYELNGKFCFLKSGILFSEIINTVSPTYALEIQTPEYGAGMEDALATRHTDVHGVLNGIDVEHWNPATDPLIPFHYKADDTAGKGENKKSLLRDVGLPFEESTAVIGIVSRFAGQKGFELLLPVFHDVMKLPVQFVVLGSGDPRLEEFFRRAAEAFSGRVYSYTGFNNELAHRITAGADMFLMPSIYEPCGLNQMYSLSYGTVPVVRKTGGLADTVRDYHEFDGKGNGFSFTERSSTALVDTIARATDVYSRPDVWSGIMLRGMRENFSWDASAQHYIELYRMARHR